MNILQIHNYYQHKGGEDQVFESEKLLLEQNGHKVFTITAHNNDILNIYSSRNLFYKNLNEIIESNLIDIAHIHNVYQVIGNDIYELLSKAKIPIVQTLHNFRFLCPAGMMLDNSGKICELCSTNSYINAFKKRCYQNSHLKSFVMSIIAKKGRDYVKKNVSVFIALNEFHKEKFIENGFDAEKFIVKPNSLPYIEKPTLNSENSYGLFIGRISPEKGVEVIIEAARIFNFPVKIVGLGNADYMQQLRKLSLGINNIEWLGAKYGEEKQKIIKNANFLIVPSICYENCPVTILEAFSYGKPVIASNIGGLPSMVAHGYNGSLFEPGNHSDLADKMILMMQQNNHAKLGENAYESFLKKYIDDNNYRQLTAIYQIAIRNKMNGTN